MRLFFITAVFSILWWMSCNSQWKFYSHQNNLYNWNKCLDWSLKMLPLSVIFTHPFRQFLWEPSESSPHCWSHFKHRRLLSSNLWNCSILFLQISTTSTITPSLRRTRPTARTSASSTGRAGWRATSRRIWSRSAVPELNLNSLLTFGDRGLVWSAGNKDGIVWVRDSLYILHTVSFNTDSWWTLFRRLRFALSWLWCNSLPPVVAGFDSWRHLERIY